MDNLTDRKTTRSKDLRIYRIPTRVLKQARLRPFTKDFIVTEVGFLSDAQSSLAPQEKTHKSHLLLFLSSGKAILQIEGTEHVVTEKQAALIPAGSSYSYGSNSDFNWSQFWMKFESTGTESLLDWTTLTASQPVANCTAAENVKRHFNAILNAVQRGYTEHTTLQLSLAIIKILISLHENPFDKENGESVSHIEHAMNQMREDVSNPQSLRTYAKRAGYSTSQFSHLFRQHTGTSPINYLNELRIQRAAEFLNNTDWSIKRIAYELGFEDPLYFSRNFRKCVGLSPRAYRAR